MYLDGNKLECEGLIELLQMLADRSEQESMERESKSVVEDDSYGRGRGHFLGIKTNMSALAGDDATSPKSESDARYANLSTLTIYLLLAVNSRMIGRLFEFLPSNGRLFTGGGCVFEWHTDLIFLDTKTIQPKTKSKRKLKLTSRKLVLTPVANKRPFLKVEVVGAYSRVGAYSGRLI